MKKFVISTAMALLLLPGASLINAEAASPFCAQPTNMSPVKIIQLNGSNCPTTKGRVNLSNCPTTSCKVNVSNCLTNNGQKLDIAKLLEEYKGQDQEVQKIKEKKKDKKDKKHKNKKEKLNKVDKLQKNESKKSEEKTQKTEAKGESTFEEQVISLVNQERANNGLQPLKENKELSKVAEEKAKDMKQNHYFSHNSPTYGSPFDMMKKFGINYSYAGENIAKGQQTPEEVMKGWMNSPGHRRNILSSNFSEIGVGFTKDSNGTTYWTQMFIDPR